MSQPQVTSRQDWLIARKELLEQEKQFQRQRDALSAKRRSLPWVLVEDDYRFMTAEGEMSLPELFDDKSQLIIQHFMLGDDWAEGCTSCSFWADGFDGATVHMEQRDAAFVAVSNASVEKIDAYRKRMGWNFQWVSCLGSSFNYDYQASFTPEQMESGKVYYNYRDTQFPVGEAPGISIFIRDAEGRVCHTYSCYSRGIDNMNVAYQYLDLLPKGRDEEDLPHAMAWVKRHDQY